MIKQNKAKQSILSKKKDGSICLEVLVQTRASRDEIVGPYGCLLKVKLTSPPVDGAANKNLLKFLSKRIKIPVSSLIIKQGQKSRQKTIFIREGDYEEIKSRLKLK